MNAKQQLAKKLGERSEWDAQVCESLAERIAQTQRIRSISEDAHAMMPPKVADTATTHSHER